MQDILFYNNLDKEFNYSEDEFRLVYSDLCETIDIYAYITNGIWQENIQDVEYKYYSETLAKKYILQSSTLLKILLGTDLNFNMLSKNIVLIDVPSIYITLRSLIENYLILHYLFIEDIPEDERRARWIIYQLSGIKSRRSIADNEFMYDKKKFILDKENNEEIELRKELEKNPYYQNIPDEFKKTIKNRNLAKLKNWADIISSSQLNKNNFHRIWKLYSNYAHSEYLSLLQIYDYWSNPNDTLSIRNISLIFTLTLTCVLIIDSTKLYKELNEYYERLENNQKRIIKLFYGVGKHTS